MSGAGRTDARHPSLCTLVSFVRLDPGYAQDVDIQEFPAEESSRHQEPVQPSADLAVEFETIGYEEFTPEVASVAEVRRFVRRLLQKLDLEEDFISGCELIADELATNALTHTGSFYGVLVEHSGASIRIGVRDDSRVLPVLRETIATSESGHGLHIVSETSNQWGTESFGVGKQTWADVSTDADGQ